MLTPQQTDLLAEVLSGHNPTCLHILGQGLSNELSEIIRDQDERLKLAIEQLDRFSQLLLPVE